MRRTLTQTSLVLFLLAALGACGHDSDDYLPTAPDVSGALVLTASSSSAPADGVSRIDLEARISANADPARRRVLFTTSAGSFFGATEPLMLTVTASEDGVARAQLVSSKMVGTARVGASVEGVASLAPRQIEVRFVPVDVSAIIRLSVSSSTAPADGTTRIQVFADVNRPGATVSFTTNRGRFVGTTNPMTGTAVANAAGRAVVDLVSSDIGPARLSATVESTTVETEVEFEPVDDTRIIQIGVSDSDRKVPADGETVTQVYAVVVPGTAQVMFTTSLGKFASGSTTATIPVGPGNRAVADLVSHDKVSTTRLTATVNGQHTAETTLDFVRALPDRLIVLLGASELEASPTKSVTVTVRLLRDIGTVTDNTVVEYQALDADAEPEKDLHFTFRNKEPSKNGVATAEVVAGSTTFREVAKIRATTDGEEKPVSGEENIQIINPKQ